MHTHTRTRAVRCTSCRVIVAKHIAKPTTTPQTAKELDRRHLHDSHDAHFFPRVVAHLTREREGNVPCSDGRGKTKPRKQSRETRTPARPTRPLPLRAVPRRSRTSPTATAYPSIRGRANKCG